MQKLCSNICIFDDRLHIFFNLYFQRKKNVSYIFSYVNLYSWKKKRQVDSKISRLLCTYLSVCYQRQYWKETWPWVFTVAPSAGVEWCCIVACNTGQSGMHSNTLKELLSLSVSTHADIWLNVQVEIKDTRRHLCMWLASVLCGSFVTQRSVHFARVLSLESLEDSHCKALKYTLDVLCVVYFQKWLYLNPLWHCKVLKEK